MQLQDLNIILHGANKSKTTTNLLPQKLTRCLMHQEKRCYFVDHINLETYYEGREGIWQEQGTSRNQQQK